MGTLLHSSESGFGRAIGSFDPDDLEPKRRRRRSDRRGADKPQQPRIKAFDRIVKLCAVRDRSEKELRDRLARDGYEDAAISEALERAVGCGLVDDARFARVLVRSRVAAGKGPVAIERDLKKHGIALESVPGWPEEFACGEDDQFERAVGLLRRNPPRSKDQWAGAYRKLVSRGYPAPVASRATRAWCEEQRAASEEDGFSS